MGYDPMDRQLVITFRDIRNNIRKRVIEISAGNLVTDDDAINMNEMSKSTVRSYWEEVKMVQMLNTADADSEVKDTGRLYFLMENDTQAYYDIVDPKDDLFVSEDGKLAMSMVAYDDLSLVNGAQNSMKFLIDDILAGRILLSDGETPHSYLHGIRL